MFLPGIAPISELRKRQSDLLKEVAKRPVVLTQHGRAVAVLVAPDEWEQLLQRLEDLQDALDAVAAREDADPIETSTSTLPAGPSVYRLRLARPAQRDLDRLHGDTWQRVQAALKALQDDPHPRGCTKLEGSPQTYRIRIGDYRAIYDVDDAEQVVTILRVRHRREVYRNLG